MRRFRKVVATWLILAFALGAFVAAPVCAYDDGTQGATKTGSQDGSVGPDGGSSDALYILILIIISIIFWR